MNTPPPVACSAIRKSYPGGIAALNGVSFELAAGEIFGIAGPDGAGKSTLFRIAATLLLPDAGSVSVMGFDTVRDFRRIRSLLGYMPGRFSLYGDLTVEENLRFFATLFGSTVEKNYSLVKDIYSHIEPFRKRRASALSGGMKQKLALSCALIHKPEVLLLDEPTTGVDPVSRKEFWEMLKRLQQQGITILVSTPYMDEAALCDRIALIADGAFMRIDTPAGLIASCDETLLAVKGDNMPQLLKLLRAHPAVKSSFAFGDAHHVAVERNCTAAALQASLPAEGNIAVEPVKPSIEDCYMFYSRR
ncbi:MAG: ABC transporter ATP-binding protein [Prevotellaceae bacterium]|jgi:ABC-type multidrug transport system ATPase subunit|nr:ABC transporter ATP-binding protein [Prevotellaceae bacterium]